ncbi:MAG: DUF4159 domain-containing protein [Balneolaceae bacterium]
MKQLFQTICLVFLLLLADGIKQLLLAQNDGEFKVARIQYRGGGDWYNDPSALSNLIDYAKERLPISISSEYDDIQIGSRDLHNYPFATLTGHGSLVINDAEVSNVRSWLDNGGFLYIDDDYGLDEYARELIRQIYPDEELVELPFEHPLYHQVYPMPDGLPKVHEHDGLPPQGFAIFREGHMVIYYSYESNLMDGWAYDVHDNPEDIVENALQMGVNLLVYALTSAR